MTGFGHIGVQINCHNKTNPVFSKNCYEGRHKIRVDFGYFHSLYRAAPAPSVSHADSEACVEQSVINLLKLIEPFHNTEQVKQWANDQRVAFHRQTLSGLVNQNISDCPAAFQNAHKNLVAAMEKSLAAGIRRTGVGGGVPLFGGIDDEQYKVFKDSESSAFDLFNKSALEIAFFLGYKIQCCKI